ncbi:PorP/SprF family type IX secretion system membrane protein [Flavobacterium gawalongense]|uniref:Type IX secretion system membrane protein PorP/SprF n=1 Tax=Flavobacterium gawalongense TaxID=2594432 RepID=A0A553BI06_9FLAO|nr:type IX secretion system membrane protein PorP/SprF [Flavobacterium gawalongense]TRX07358.1 type IX secretion system membrane protein PorP/SprF [Flavobacterium gawalongense]TRX07878.1 type IX secretion system membrane protein PorP/SprF [Flavobacterium gawalongense]TRX23321.1 type IX secretion system membrane protein PorP/SprF [Flavobacterium gawalongense]
MKKLILSFFLLAVTSGYSQELNLPVFTQYLADNHFVIAPTFAGIGDNLKIRANGLTQWVGIKDAPDNQSVYADFRIADQSGVGVSFYNDSNGNTRQTGAKFSFAHHLILDYYTKQYLSLGISYNINNFKIDINNFNTTYEIPVLDPSITDNRFVSNNNFDVGALYRNKSFYLSLNASNILNKNADKFSGVEPVLLRNYQVYSGYVFKSPTNSRVEYEPSVFYQFFASDKRSSTDVNIKYRHFNKYEDYYWAGISYRFLNDQFFKPLNLGPMLGFKKSNFYFGYSYQLTLNQLAAFNTGTHVVTIGLDFLAGISNCPCTQSPVHD